MARIRSIKPEFWSSEQVMECSPNARLLFIGIWNFADDAGRIPNSAKTIKAQVLPGDDISTEIIRGMIDELSANGLLMPYTVDGKEYLLITGWHHQKIDKPQRPKYPPPPPDHSPNIPRKVATDLKGSERKGKDQIDAPDGASTTGKVYAFEDGVIRLNERDLGSWQKAFSHLDVPAELLSLSKWAESEGKNWFHAVKGALAKRNREVKAAHDRPAPNPNEPKWLDGIEGVL